MENIEQIECPYCGEYIDSQSNFCEYCGENLEALHQKENDDILNSEKSNFSFKKQVFIIITAILIVVMIFVVLWFFSSNLDVNIYPNNERKNEQSTEQKISNNETKQDIEKAKQLYADKDYIGAGKILQQIIDSNNSPIANYYMGEVYKDQGYLKIAIKYYQEANKNKNNFYEAKKRLAQTYYEYNDSDNALLYGNNAYSINSKDKELLDLLITLYRDERDDDKLLELNKALVLVDPKNYEANDYIASYYLNKEQYKESIKYIETMLNIKFNTKTAYALAYCYAKMEYYTQAIKILDEIQEYDYSEYYRAEQYKENMSLLRDSYNFEHSKNTKKK